MSDSNDDVQNYALAVLAAVVALVIGGVITLAASSSGAKRAAAAAAAQAAVPDDAERVFFAVDSDQLPPEAMDTLARIAEAARANPNASVLISGYHDASGDPARNADLAKRRAQAVQHALEANGVTPNQLVLDKPRETIGGSDPREARRVELRVR
ncbi:MAG: OmpA family protein [Piscinibacter sp.]|nr:OmpA family protein [Piscinibacter sp.]